MLIYSILIFQVLFNIYPEYIKILNDYYWENLFYSKDFQDYKINKLIENLEKGEHELIIGDNFKIKKLKEKEIKKLKIQWRFSRSMYKIEEDKYIDADATVGPGYLSSDESIKKFTIKESKLEKDKIGIIYKLKDKNSIKICREYRNQEWCFFYNIEYYLINEKGLAIQMADLRNKKIRFSILAIDDGGYGWANTKNLKIYANIKNIN